MYVCILLPVLTTDRE